jgi:hypothetical protein
MGRHTEKSVRTVKFAYWEDGVPYIGYEPIARHLFNSRARGLFDYTGSHR